MMVFVDRTADGKLTRVALCVLKYHVERKTREGIRGVALARCCRHFRQKGKEAHQIRNDVALATAAISKASAVQAVLVAVGERTIIGETGC